MKSRNNRKQMVTRIGWVGAILCLSVFILVVRLVKLQIIDSAELSARNNSQIKETRTLQSPRGTIYDRNGRPLAVSAVTQSLYGDPKMLNKSPQEVATLLAPYVRLKEADIVKDLEEDTAFVWLDRMMDRDKSKAVEDIIKKNGIVGLGFVDESRRFYPNGPLLSQVLGFVGIDDKGLDGLEMVLDKDIRGGVTNMLVMTDRKGEPILDGVYSKFIPEQEKSVTLTIDTTVQYIAERALAKAMKTTKASGASIIIMDPKTGAILAMANQPTYDPNNYSKGTEKEFKNIAVTNLYEPGSTFKPIIASGALATGKWTLDTVYNDVGSVAASGHVIRNWDDSAYGPVTLLQILKFSINTGMAHIGLTVGAHDLLQYVKAFGFGESTGIELPGEGSGILFDEKDMVPLDTATMSIGQGIAVTPLQMVQAFGALANKGHMMHPHIIKTINQPDGTVVQAEDVREVGNPISETVASEITNILEQEVSTGGGNKAMVEGYKFAGKTGTAEKLNPVNGGYLKGRYIASFIGYGPVEDPQFVALIVIDDPEGTFYGGQIAAPVFQEIMTQLVRYYKISPTLKKIEKPTGEVKAHTAKVEYTSDGSVIVPSFSGWTMGEVQDYLVEAKLKFKPTGSGYAVDQTPSAGSTLDTGDVVSVNFSE